MKVDEKKRTLDVKASPVKDVKLTESMIGRIKKPKKITKYFDGKGLYLLAHPSGGKYWRYRYSFGGKEKLLSVGVWPEVSLADARKKKAELRKRLKSGFNPSTDRVVERSKIIGKERTRRAVSEIFREYAQTFAQKLAVQIFQEIEDRYLKDKS